MESILDDASTLWLPADTQTPWQASASLERVRLERIPPRAKVTCAVWALGETTIGESHDVELAPTCVTRTDGHTQPTLVHESTTGRRVHTRDVGVEAVSRDGCPQQTLSRRVLAHAFLTIQVLRRKRRR